MESCHEGTFQGKSVFCALTSAGSSPAYAEELVDATMPERIYEIARGFGSAELGKDSQGDPASSGESDGTSTGCISMAAPKGGSATTSSSPPAGAAPRFLEKINEWNRDKRFGKAYIDSDGDPHSR